jgi:hypothetical protein
VPYPVVHLEPVVGLVETIRLVAQCCTGTRSTTGDRSSPPKSDPLVMQPSRIDLPLAHKFKSLAPGYIPIDKGPRGEGDPVSHGWALKPLGIK